MASILAGVGGRGYTDAEPRYGAERAADGGDQGVRGAGGAGLAAAGGCRGGGALEAVGRERERERERERGKQRGFSCVHSAGSF